MNENIEKIAQDVAKFSFLEASQSFPVVVEPTNAKTDPFGWVSDHKALIEQKLLLHGAILFRGFNIDTIATFRRLINPLITEAMRHPEMIAGRQEVGDAVYTPTKYPPDQQIAPHNEHSASLTFPGRLAFWCQVPAERGGETPIVDTRKVYKRLDPRVRDKFERLGWMLVPITTTCRSAGGRRYSRPRVARKSRRIARKTKSIASGHPATNCARGECSRR